MDFEDLFQAAQKAIRSASRHIEICSLGGVNIVSLETYRKIEDEAIEKLGLNFETEFDPECEPNPYDKIIEILKSALDEVESLKTHKHEWVVDDDDRCLCSICGADGDA